MKEGGRHLAAPLAKKFGILAGFCKLVIDTGGGGCIILAVYTHLSVLRRRVQWCTHRASQRVPEGRALPASPPSIFPCEQYSP